jgi:SAM-dependent methyltransferase
MHDPSGWTDSAQAWITRVDTFDFARVVLLDEPMIRLCGDLRGKRVLDVGCGEGRYCRMLQEQGATTVGLDPTEPLLARAKERDPGGTYVKGSGEQLPFEDDFFDVVAFYLTLIDIPDYRKAIQEAARVLKPGGQMVIGNLAPHATTSPTGWVRDAQGNKLYFPIDNYCEEWGTEVAWAGIKVINYHRPLSDYMSAFLGGGLMLREYLEPVPTKEFVEKNPDFEYERRVPYVVAMLWEKPHG